VLTKQVKDKNNGKQKDSRDLRRNEAKNVEKRTKANKIVAGIQTAESALAKVLSRLKKVSTPRHPLFLFAN